jgi:hypothetical protein
MWHTPMAYGCYYLIAALLLGGVIGKRIHERSQSYRRPFEGM